VQDNAVVASHCEERLQHGTIALACACTHDGIQTLVAPADALARILQVLQQRRLHLGGTMHHMEVVGDRLVLQERGFFVHIYQVRSCLRASAISVLGDLADGLSMAKTCLCSQWVPLMPLLCAWPGQGPAFFHLGDSLCPLISVLLLLLLQLPSLAFLVLIQDQDLQPGFQLLPMLEQDLLVAVMGAGLYVWDMQVRHGSMRAGLEEGGGEGRWQQMTAESAMHASN
jgi:hypothetical protein